MTRSDNNLLDDGASDESDALLSRLRLIEDQPLDTRAAALAQVHDRLQARLEGSDTPPSRG
jgi:hypothetical protein